MPTLDPEVRRFHEHRVAERLLDRRERLRAAAFPVDAADDRIRADRQAVRGEHDLHDPLVHADRGREHAGADVRHVGELEQPLDRAVLAVGSVQDREDHVEVEAGHDRLSRAVRFAASDRSRGWCRRSGARRGAPRGRRATAAPRRAAPARSPPRPTSSSADARRCSTGRPSRCGSQPVRSACDRGCRTRRPPTRATLRARPTARRRARRPEDVSRR